MNTLIETIFLIAITFSIIYTLTAVAFFMAEKLRHKLPSKAISDYPPVSVFKPLKGLDNNLEENLRSFFNLDYPQYELIFGVKDYDDPAIAIVRNLQREYPQVSTKLVVDSFGVGTNPKVNNLYNMYPHAQYEYFIISDSNVRVKPDYITKIIENFTSPLVGLVTSTIRGTGAAHFGAALENLHLNTYIAASVFIVTRLFKVPVTIGKSMMIRRDTMDSLGGFAAFANYLLEDGILGREVKRLGLEVRTSVEQIENINSTWSVRNFISRHLRWAIMRRHFNLANYAAEILSNPIALSLIYCLWRLDNVSLNIFLAAIAIKLLADLLTVIFMGDKLIWRYFYLVPAKDILMAVIWIIPFFKSTVNWRGNIFRVLKDTAIIPVKPAYYTISPSFIISGFKRKFTPVFYNR